MSPYIFAFSNERTVNQCLQLFYKKEEEIQTQGKR